MIVILLGAVAIVLGTVLGSSTFSAIIVGAAIGYLRPVRAARYAFGAGALGWGGLLLFAAIRSGEIGSLTGKLGEILGLPGIVMVVVTLLYPAVLAGSAAWLVAAIRTMRGERTASERP